MSTVLVTGSATGLGKAIVEQLRQFDHKVIEYDIKDGRDALQPNFVGLGIEKLDVLINCAGVNLIDWLENFSDEQWDKVMDTNAKSIFKMTQACLPWLIKSQGTVLNIVSNAAHMPMTCSLAYNASKGAALIMTKQLARELTKKHGITVFSVSPNKLHGTGMSDAIDEQVVKTRGWTKEYAQQYQLSGLLTGKETPCEVVAEFIAFLLISKRNHEYLSGCDLTYGL